MAGSGYSVSSMRESNQVEQIVLPALRENLSVFQGARRWDGAPTWVIFDPLRNRYFQIDFHLFSTLCEWSPGDASRLISSLKEKGIEVDQEDVKGMVEFLGENELLDVPDSDQRRKLQHTARRKTMSWFKALMHKYLFFKVPLIRPDPILERIYPFVRPLFSKDFLIFTGIVGLLGLLFALFRWNTFFSTFLWFFTLEGAIVFAFVLMTVKLLHELGHGLACKHYGVGVPSMGVAFLVMWPVLYTDASDAWRIKSRKKRALIDSAGVITELIIAAYALFFWALAPDGIVKSVLFVVCTTTLVLSLAVNLNPFMRFDGYYFLSDTLNIPNLQERAFNITKWHIRKWLLGVETERSELFSDVMTRWLIVYSISTWIYRFFLFLCIALLVYHLFFKALGIVLFVVEIWWFIVRPVYNELTNWRGLMPVVSRARKLGWSLFGAALLLLLMLPLGGAVKAPAYMLPDGVARIYTSGEGVIEEIYVGNGDKAEAGQKIMRIRSMDLESQLAQARLSVQRLEGVIDRVVTDDITLARRQVLHEELERARAEEEVVNAALSRLMVLAPASGKIVDFSVDLHVGRVVGRNAKVAAIVPSEQRYQVVAWVSERHVERLSSGAEALFYPAAKGGVVRALYLNHLDSTTVAILDNPVHASVYGGEIAVKPDRDGFLVPREGVYRAILYGEVVDPGFNHGMKGWVVISAERVSIFSRVFRRVVGTLIQESGF